MMNLFNIFDPSTLINNMQINWLSTIMTMILIPNMMWIMPNRMYLMIMKMKLFINNEMMLLYKNKNFKSISFLFITLFMFILLNNFISLFPYIFSSSSHLVFSMTLAIPFWLFFIIMSSIKNTSNLISHLVPLNTPMMLTPFMVLIETTSLLIRPLSLSVRLMANMIAGHMLMTLLNFNSLMFIIIFLQMFFMMFELCVAMIQSYVFSILSSLYASE